MDLMALIQWIIRAPADSLLNSAFYPHRAEKSASGVKTIFNIAGRTFGSFAGELVGLWPRAFP